MCGISGLFERNGGVTSSILEDMASTLRHRGPDHLGTFVSTDGRVGLAHNRLSIIDLSVAGHQPLTSDEPGCHIVFNGEIYNFPTLRQSLRNSRDFRSNTDTEVLLRLYCQKGIAVLNDLNGMFAFCIHDEDQHRMLLARDRVGIKPLYYVAKAGRFAFASEPKALLRLPFVSRELDPVALDAYLTLGYIPSELCIFRDIRKLPPAHYAVLDLTSGSLCIRRYWDLCSAAEQRVAVPLSDLAEMLEARLRDAVRLQLVSDVPIGCFLSGGLDSSLVASIMAQESNSAINTFNIAFETPDHDESRYARLVAEHIGSRHVEYCLHMDAATVLPGLADYFDEPFADSSMIPTYYVSKIAREHVTVVLSGDGGDELFAGYNWYSWMLALQRAETALGPFASAVSRLAGSRSFHGLLPKRKFLMSVGRDWPKQFLDRVGLFTVEQREGLYDDGMVSYSQGRDYGRHVQNTLRSFDGDLLRRMTLTDFHSYLPDDILTKVDRASMAVSLETRVPWLDHRLVEYAFSVPSKVKIRRGRKKHLAKEVARGLLPRALPLERKRGFTIPLQQWMRERLGEMLEAHLDDHGGPDYIDKQVVRQSLREHRMRRDSRRGFQLFAVLCLLLWHDRYLRR